MRNSFVFKPSRVLSIEREFCIFSKKGNRIRYATKEQCDRLVKRFKKIASSRGFKNIGCSGEVAHNMVEIKVGFSTFSDFAKDLVVAYSLLYEACDSEDLIPFGLSQPFYDNGTNDFFTTVAFPDSRIPLSRISAIHLHFGCISEKDLFTLHRAASSVSDIILFSSQSLAVGSTHFRKSELDRFFQTVPEVMHKKRGFSGLKDFSDFLELCRLEAEKSINSNCSNLEKLLSYEIVSSDENGRVSVLEITPDKVFQMARPRPDLSVKNKGLFGSVEFRSLDGQADVLADICAVAFSIGLIMLSMEDGFMGEESGFEFKDMVSFGIPRVLESYGVDLRFVSRNLFDFCENGNIRRVSSEEEFFDLVLENSANSSTILKGVLSWIL